MTAFETTFFENAQRIFDVARADASGEPMEMALMIRPDGGLHIVMDSPVTPEGAAVHGGARTVYQISRRGGNVRVSGQSPSGNCVLENKAPRRNLLRDQLLYGVVSGSGGVSSAIVPADVWRGTAA